ncbi:MAG: type I DNA topoisomerase [Bacteroidetes bacterium]|nr:type I DNA topoisomerase [Bacteroidota bacterium]
MTKNLVIVESPAKAKTIGGFLGSEFTVKSCMGHVADLSKKDLGVDVNKGFEPKYIVSPDKKKIVGELKKLAQDSECVWLASDEDREGEAIAWHLMETLGLKKENTRRIAFHEITRSAILEAIDNPRELDMNLVDAQQARRVLDRLVGFELSPLLWKKIKPSLSAGRVQSVAVRLIVEREDEIRNFVAVSAYRITGDFIVQEGKKLKTVSAELNKRFQSKEEALNFLKQCINVNYTVEDVETKPSKKSPAPPFTTSTLQQEASRKLGFSVANTMRVAQELYESGKITYMRTDSVNLSDMALAMARKEVTETFGEEYVKTRKYATKTKGAQEAHEAIRPTFLSNKNIEADRSGKRLYDLIWKRTIASQMADAELEKTNVTIGVSGKSEKFIARGEVIRFDGFLKVYMESSDEDSTDDQEGVLPPLKAGEQLSLREMIAQQKFTQQPYRYTEATLVKKLEELGIGRPSTYAPIISTIQKRDYVVKEERQGVQRNYDYISLKDSTVSETVKTETVGYEKGKLFPTDIGGLVTGFLVQNFNDILDYNFTATVEEEFDEIAEGKLAWKEMLKEFYFPFHEKIEGAMENTKKVKGEKLLGTDPATGLNIYVKIGRFGPMAQLGEADNDAKPRFAALKKGQSIDTISLDETLELFKLPRSLGDFEGTEVIVSAGKFGPYIKHKSAFFSLPVSDDPLVVNLARAIEIVHEKRHEEIKKVIREYPEDSDIKVLNGRYGPYISYKKENYKIPKGKTAADLTYDDVKAILTSSEPTKSKSKKKK